MKVKAPKTPTVVEDPAIKAAREREEQRADAALTSGTQALLSDETRRRIRRFGRRAALTGAPGAPNMIAGGGIPLVGPVTGGGGGGTGGSGAGAGGGYSDSFAGGGGGFGRMMSV